MIRARYICDTLLSVNDKQCQKYDNINGAMIVGLIPKKWCQIMSILIHPTVTALAAKNENTANGKPRCFDGFYQTIAWSNKLMIIIIRLILNNNK